MPPALVAHLAANKTYFVAAAIGLVAALQFLGALSSDSAGALYALLGAGGAAALRHETGKPQG